MIYIDPPYNTGKDFVYADDYRDNIRNYLALTGQIDGEESETVVELGDLREISYGLVKHDVPTAETGEKSTDE